MAKPGTSSTTVSADIAALKQMVVEQAARIAILEEQLRLAVHQRFAPKSEKLWMRDQSDLFNEAEHLGGAIDTDAASASDVAEITVPEHTRKRGKRKPIDASLPRVRVEHDLSDAAKTCPCGCQLTRIGEAVSEQYDIEPAKARVIRNVRFKYACRTCEGSSHDGPAVTVAPLPAQPIPKSNASPGLLAYIATSKFQDGLPHYRLEGILARSGIELPRATAASWMIRLGQLVTPIINLMDETQLAYDVLQMDETTVQVLKEDGRAAEAKSFMWVRRGGEPGRPIILFDYAATRAASVPMRILAEYKGFLQSDGYAGYTKAGKRDGVISVGCLGHARRKFHDAIKAQKKGAVSTAALAASEGRPTRTPTIAEQALILIRKIYAIEKAAREARLTPAQRHKLRNEKARPIWDELRRWLDAHIGTVPPKSLTGKALSYLASEWPRLIRVLDDGRLEVDNNFCENAIRPFVMGRKAWLFSDTPRGAEASARLYGLIETAKANGLQPFEYLKRLFAELPKATTLAEIEALLPWNVPQPATQSVAA